MCTALFVHWTRSLPLSAARSHISLSIAGLLQGRMELASPGAGRPPLILGSQSWLFRCAPWVGTLDAAPCMQRRQCCRYSQLCRRRSPCAEK